MNVASRARGLLTQALGAYQDSPRAANWLGRQLERFDEPLRLAVVGPPRSGKSTLVQAIGEIPGELTLIDAPPPAPDTIENICLEADAVLYLVRHPHGADLDFLYTLQDHPIARAAAVNAIVVLSRADELGGGRLEALISARRLARRYRCEPELRGLCQDVVAVAGLLARAGRNLSQPEYDALAELARIERAKLEPYLLSADRFSTISPGHATLLERFGLFGIRVAISLLRQEARSLTELSAELLPRSGLSELLESIDGNFAQRREVLKARSALLGLEVVLRMEPRPAAAAIGAELERTLASAHDFTELRLLAAIRTGRVSLPRDFQQEAVQLVGGHGVGPAERLAEVDLSESIARWREFAESPGLGSDQRRAAAVVLRSCEAMASGAL
ncbi:hypothetical protein [Amycolatopsis taiwanensis]|uniref:GTPase n=1 Tax=Amycolatopsis taiwanensis TaxID=342230 RepID=A0A9W6QTL7_9PSEU|nr:hypothetical protein [Amycolatopsis taiwanensis]GLY63979.1 GTPase [Amycolatopsis taiwanensis]